MTLLAFSGFSSANADPGFNYGGTTPGYSYDGIWGRNTEGVPAKGQPDNNGYNWMTPIGWYSYIGGKTLTCTVPAAQGDDLYVGFAVSGSIGANTTYPLFSYTGPRANVQVFGNWGSTFWIYVNGAQVASFNPGGANGWVYVEIFVSLKSDATGKVEVRKDGTVLYTWTGVTASPTSKAASPTVTINTDPGYGMSIDDMYVLDGSGQDFNTYLGDIKVQRLRPTSVAQSGGFAVTGASDAVTALADNNGGTYVTATASGAEEDYDLEDVQFSSKVLAARPVMVAYKDANEAGPARASFVVKMNGAKTVYAPQDLSTTSTSIPGPILSRGLTALSIKQAQVGIKLENLGG